MKTQTIIRTTALAFVAMLAVIPVACATGNANGAEQATRPIDLIVNNNLLLDRDITVYAIRWDGKRSLIGSVPPRATRTFSFQPEAYSGRYYLIAQRVRGRDIRSESFSILPDMDGTITWSMIPNLLGFQGPAPDTATVP
jgi:hypothetical protein